VTHGGVEYRAAVHGIALLSDESVCVGVATASGAGAIYRKDSLIGLSTWQSVLWSDHAFYAIFFPMDSVGYAVGGEGALAKTVDAGLTWTQSSTGSGSTLYGVSFISADTGWAVGDSGVILRTNDGGDTWHPQSSGVSARLRSVSFAGTDTGFVVGAGVILGTTTGGGALANRRPRPFLRTAPADDSGFSYDPPNSPPIVFRWTRSEDPDGDPIQYLVHVWWNDVSLTIETADTVIADSLRPFWGAGFAEVVLNMNWNVLSTDSRDTVEAVNGAGTFALTFPDAVDGPSAQIPSTYSLNNYPNPFNPTTTIAINLPLETHVALRVFDVTGRCVSVLVDRTMQAGRHSVVFDGRALSSGVYFYRLEAGDFRESRKMVLLK
jgi:hypothetical protein